MCLNLYLCLPCCQNSFINAEIGQNLQIATYYFNRHRGLRFVLNKCYVLIYRLYCVYRQERASVSDEANQAGRLAKRKVMLSPVEQNTTSSSCESKPKRFVNEHQPYFVCITELCIFYNVTFILF